MHWFGIVLWIVYGGLIGYLGSTMMKTAKENVTEDLVAGLIGAIIGGWVGQYFWSYTAYAPFTWMSVLLSAVGAAILVAVLKAYRTST